MRQAPSRNPDMTPERLAIIESNDPDCGKAFVASICTMRHRAAKNKEAKGIEHGPCAYCPLILKFLGRDVTKSAYKPESEAEPGRTICRRCERYAKPGFDFCSDCLVRPGKLKFAEKHQEEDILNRRPNRKSDKTCETCGKRLTINGHCMSCNARKARSKSEEKPLKISKRVARQFEKAVEKPAPKTGAMKTLPNLPASQLCQEFQIQNCHDCDDLTCGDNLRKPAADTTHAAKLPDLEKYVLANPPKRAQLLSLHRTLTEQARELMTRKNADYGANADPFANFRMSALLHIEPEFGVLLRMQDKMARLVSFLEKGELAVKEESWSDAIIDIINYSVLLCGLLRERVET